jgi:hypothetical protein
MIDIQIQGRKPRVTFTGTPSTERWLPEEPSPYDKVVTILDEAKRRDNIVHNLYSQAGYRAGDTVVCSTKEHAEQWGEQIQVLAIAQTYAQMGRNEKWPNNDNPMIVHARSHLKNTTFFCTTNFLTKRREE